MARAVSGLSRPNAGVDATRRARRMRDRAQSAYAYAFANADARQNQSPLHRAHWLNRLARSLPRRWPV